MADRETVAIALDGLYRLQRRFQAFGGDADKTPDIVLATQDGDRLLPFRQHVVGPQTPLRKDGAACPGFLVRAVPAGLQLTLDRAEVKDELIPDVCHAS